MNFLNFTKSWRGALAENRFHRIIRGVELAVICALIGLLYTQKTIVTVVPPNLDQEVSITKNGADENFKKAWGYFTAGMMGNVTPQNVDFILSSLTDIMAPEVYQEIVASLSSQAESVKSENLVTQFEIQAVQYNRNQDLVFVTGRHTTKGSFGEPDIKHRTYEFKVGVRNYKPTILYLDVYSGGPKSEQEREREAQKLEDNA